METHSPQPELRTRAFGLLAGQVWMSPDFDDPLEEWVALFEDRSPEDG